MSKPKVELKSIRLVLPIIIPFALATLLLHEQIIDGKIIWYGDAVSFFYPTRHYVAQRMLSGQMPLWNSYSNMGITSLAEPQYQVFYPPLWLTLPLPAWFAISLMTWLHVSLSGCFAYALFRQLKLSMLSSMFGATAFMLSGFIQGHMSHLIHVLAYPYLPLLLLLVHRAIASRGNILAWSLGCSFIISLQLLTGSQFAYYSLIVALAFSIVVSLDGANDWRRCVLLWLITMILCYGICAIQVLPTLEVASFSARRPSLQASSEHSLPPIRWLISAVLPNFYGTFVSGFTAIDPISNEEAFSFVGHAALLLAIFGALVCFKQNRFAAFFSMLALVSLLFSFGRYTPIWRVLAPVASALYMYRCPSRWLLVYTMSISALASIGMEHLLSGQVMKRNWIFPTSIALYALCLIAVLLFRSKQSQDAFALLLDSLLVVLLLCYALLALRWIVRNFVAADAVFLTIGIACELLILAQGMHFSHGANPNVFESAPEIVAYIGKHERYFSERFPIAPLLLANGYLKSGKCSNKPDAITLAQLNLLKRNLNVPNLKRSPHTEGVLVSRPIWTVPFFIASDLRHRDNERLYRIAGVRCIITIWKCHNLNLRAQTEDGVLVYEDTEAMPLLYFVGHAQIVHTTDEAIKLIKRQSFDPKSEVALLHMGRSERSVARNSNANVTSTGASRLTIKSWGHEVFEAECETKCDGWLVWLECFHPGWKAFVDGFPSAIGCANGAFMAVRVNAGTHKVMFVFFPTSYMVGSFVTMCTLLAISAMLTCRALLSLGLKEKQLLSGNAMQ